MSEPRALTDAQKVAAFDLIADAVPLKVLKKALGVSSRQDLADHLCISDSTLKLCVSLPLLPRPDVALGKRAFYSEGRVREAARARHPRLGKYAASPVLAEMRAMAAGGATYRQIGERFGVSRQAVHQLLKRYTKRGEAELEVKIPRNYRSGG